jgi:RimJ/RimL family protein N-acetyltransferase
MKEFLTLRTDEKASSVCRRLNGNKNITVIDWPNFDNTSLEGERVSLATINSNDDAADLFEAATFGDKEQNIWRFMGFGPFLDENKMKDWLYECENSREPLFFGFRDKISGHLGGLGSFMEIRPKVGVVEIGNIWLGGKWQRDVKGTESLSLMMHHAMHTLGYRRLEWKCNALNLASRSAALRLGFRYEGTFLNHLIVKGKSRDTSWFSITEQEWPRVYSAHLSWLDAVNFDELGVQKVSLQSLTKTLW